MLAEIVSSRTRAEIFRLLFNSKGVEIHNREVERRSGISESAVRKELGHLRRIDLLKRRKDGNRTYYKANANHPLYPEIRNLVLKTTGLVDVLRDALDVTAIQIAFVFGSVVKGEEKAGSDVDLMVIGKVGLRKLTELLTGVQDVIDREVNPFVLTIREYRKRLADKDHFITSVDKSPRLFVIGAEDDLAAMV